MQNIVSFREVEAYIARVWQGQRCAVKPYFINFEFSDVAPGASADATQKINSNADFLLCDIRAKDSGAGAQNARLQIVDNGSLERFFAEAVSLASVATFANYGYADMSIPRRIAGNSSITATYTADANNLANSFLQLTFAGVLVLPYSGR